MDHDPQSLMAIFEGWDGYQTSLVRAIEPLTREQLSWRPSPEMRSAGETAGHIAFGRIDWFSRMGVSRAVSLASAAADEGVIGGRPPQTVIKDAAAVVRWLEASWQMVDETLRAWTTADLWVTYRQPYQGTVYAVTRQWTIWRVMAHDIQHGGQLTILLGAQGIALPELADLGGHLTVPPVAPD